MWRPSLFFLVLALALPACSDYQLYPTNPHREEGPGGPPNSAPPAHPEGLPPVAAPQDPPTSGPPGGPESPWPDPNPGNLPDLVFVAPWSSSSGVTDFEGPSPNNPVEPLSWSYVAFDLLGQVLLELELPQQEGRITNPKSVEPAGPGRFLGSVQWMDQETGEIGWEAWLIDAFSEEMELVVTWNDTNGTIWLPQAEREVQLAEGPILLHLAVWPTDPDRIVLWAEDLSPEPSLPPLRVSHLRDASVADTFYDPYALFSGGASSMGPMVPWDLDVRLSPNGDPVILGGTRLAGVDSFQSAWDLTAWSPQLGTFWSSAIDWPGVKQEASMGVGGSTPLATVWGSLSDQHPTSSSLIALRDGTPELAAITEQEFNRVGPVLDPLGPTVTTVGTNTHLEDVGDQIDIFHEGELVWTISDLRFGLVYRTGFFGQLILLDAGTSGQ